MLWTISLFDLQPGVSPETLTRHLKDGLTEYEAYLESRGQRLLGLYQAEVEMKTGESRPGTALGGRWAEVCLADGANPSEAALREVQTARTPANESWFNERHALIAPERSTRLWLQPLGLSPLAGAPFRLQGCLLHLTLRHLPAGKTVQELTEFDERIIGRYAEYMLQARWVHVGTYHLFGLPEYMYVDTLDVIEATDQAEALANDAAVPVTAEIQSIYDECGLFLDKNQERYQLWLSPVILGHAARDGVIMG